jgi:SAM-dependent MidA family methyltransferase
VLSALEGFELGTAAYLKQATAVNRLLQPSEMGELFKVIALGKGYGKTPLGFAAGDRRHAL